MKRNSIYLDTSVLNFFFEKRDIDKENSTKDLFMEIKQVTYGKTQNQAGSKSS